MSKLSERFFNRLRRELKINIPAGSTVVATRSGYWQRAAGACTSVIESSYGSGSHIELLLFRPIRNLIKCPNLEKYTLYDDLVVDCGCKGKCKGDKK